MNNIAFNIAQGIRPDLPMRLLHPRIIHGSSYQETNKYIIKDIPFSKDQYQFLRHTLKREGLIRRSTNVYFDLWYFCKPRNE